MSNSPNVPLDGAAACTDHTEFHPRFDAFPKGEFPFLMVGLFVYLQQNAPWEGGVHICKLAYGDLTWENHMPFGIL